MNTNTKVETARAKDPVIDGEYPVRRIRLTVLSPILCSVLATVGIFGGISALFSGMVCVVIHALINGDKAFDTVGTGLLISAIPMILIGSIFLDEIEKKK